jgi:hypothetical protein
VPREVDDPGREAGCERRRYRRAAILVRLVEFAEESKVRGVGSRFRVVAQPGRLVVAVGRKDAEDVFAHRRWERDLVPIAPIGGGGEDEDSRAVGVSDGVADDFLEVLEPRRDGDDVDLVPDCPFDRLGNVSESWT